MKYAGKKYPRYEGVDKVTGSYLYTTDIKLPRMLYAKLKLSDRAHAKILDVDVIRAKRVPGVVAVLTGQDLDHRFGIYVQDEPFIAKGKVRYCGEPIAAVSATSPEAAAEAVDLIRATYEDLPPVLDVMEAVSPDAPLVHPDLGSYDVAPIFQARPNSNICTFVNIKKGDPEKAFLQADRVFSSEFYSPPVAHCPLEPHICIAQVDLSGRITLWDAIQSPFLVRRELAMALGIPLNRIRVKVHGLGGAFGGKSYTRIEPVTVALALHSKNRPVKLLLTREEEFTITVHKEPCKVFIKSGVMNDGTIVAREVKAYYDGGAYAEGTPLVVRNACFTAAGPYDIEHVSIEGYCVYTNNLISGPMRGFGTPQLTWAYESHMDDIAREMNIDPLEIRLKNCIEEGDELPSGEIIRSLGMRQTLEAAAKEAEYEKFKGRSDVGIGLACCHKLSFSPATSSAVVRLDEDGSVQLNCSTVEMGQGSNNTLIQIAAECLEIPFERFTVGAPDTDYTPYDQSTTGSRSTFTAGNAVIKACEELKAQLREIASVCYGLPPEEMETVDGHVRVIGSDDCGLPYEELVQRHYKPRKASLIGKGIFTSSAVLPDVKTGKTPKASAFWMYGTQVVIARLDTATGQSEVLKVISAYDLGRVINREGAETQIEGGVVQGLGTIMSEEMILECGRLVNPNYRDYQIPTIMETPEVIPICVESRHPEGPYGAKGHGELVLNATAPALSNAIFKLTGVRVYSLPVTPEKVWRALEAHKRGRE